MSFYDDIKEEMRETVYCEDNDMSEQIEYWPLGVEANKRTIWAVVLRPDSQLSGNVQAPAFIIQLLNDSTYGVASTGINVGLDIYKFADRKGKTATEHNNSRLESHDLAELVLTF